MKTPNRFIFRGKFKFKNMGSLSWKIFVQPFIGIVNPHYMKGTFYNNRIDYLNGIDRYEDTF